VERRRLVPVKLRDYDKTRGRPHPILKSTLPSIRSWLNSR